ncbi:MAG: hypothetical protein HC915_09355 [Anaerolineae bacterium]|nr:hypothetical protein [Anaerolineae bacterium]
MESHGARLRPPRPPRWGWLWWVMVLSLAGVGCESLFSPTPTPIFVTATPQFIVVTNTPVPTASPVLAPTVLLPNDLPGQEAAALPSATPSPQPSLAITNTPTFTPTPTNTPPTPGAVIGLVGGVVAQAECQVAPQGGFGTLYSAAPELREQLGCPLGDGSAQSVNNAFQSYENGIMIWVSRLPDTGQGGIFAIFNNSTYQRFNDTWQSGVDPESLGVAAPEGRLEPVRGFGKIWRESIGVRDGLGWATTPELGGTAFILGFERGDMLYVPQDGQTYILVAGAPGTWRSVSQGY